MNKLRVLTLLRRTNPSANHMMTPIRQATHKQGPTITFCCSSNSKDDQLSTGSIVQYKSRLAQATATSYHSVKWSHYNKPVIRRLAAVKEDTILIVC